MSKDLPKALRWPEPLPRAQQEDDPDATAERVAPHWLRIAEVTPEVAYDPYNTGAFRVLGEKPRRRTLDDMRKLDVELKRLKKPWQ